MSGFAGFVNYHTNYMQDLDGITRCLWKMADKLGIGVNNGIDVVEDNGAFIQNSCYPMTSSEYYSKEGGRSLYLFKKGYIRKGYMRWDEAARNTCGALFLPGNYVLYLFRNYNSSPVYYKICGAHTLVFATNPCVLDVYEGCAPYSILNPGKVLEFGINGMRILPIKLFPIVNFLV